MKPGATLQSVQAELNVMADAIEKTGPTATSTENHALPLVDELLGTTRPAMTTLFGMALLVLAISMFNAASIFHRPRRGAPARYAIRVALGASRPRCCARCCGDADRVDHCRGDRLRPRARRRGRARAHRSGHDPAVARSHGPAVDYIFAALAAILVALVCALFASLRSGGWMDCATV